MSLVKRIVRTDYDTDAVIDQLDAKTLGVYVKLLRFPQDGTISQELLKELAQVGSTEMTRIMKRLEALRLLKRVPVKGVGRNRFDGFEWQVKVIKFDFNE